MKSLLTLQELSDESGIPVATLRANCAPSGDLPAVRLSQGPSAKRRTRGKIRVRREDFENWLLRHRTAQEEQKASLRPRADIRDLPGASRFIS